MLITNAFTCTGPYAILIMLGIKRVENRNMMPSPAKGRCAVGCSKSFCKEEFGAFVHFERPIPCRGNVGMWQMPTAFAAAVGAAVLTDMDSEIAVLEKKVEKYRQFKSGMMSELLTGKVRLTEGK